MGQINGANLLAFCSLAQQAEDSARTTRGNMEALVQHYVELQTEIRNLRDEVERYKNQDEVAKTIISAGVELMPCDKLGEWRGVRTYLEQTAEQYEPFKTTSNARDNATPACGRSR